MTHGLNARPGAHPRPSSGRTADRCRSRRRNSPAGAAATPLAAPAGPGAGGANLRRRAVQPRPLHSTGGHATTPPPRPPPPACDHRAHGTLPGVVRACSRRAWPGVAAPGSVLLILFCLAGGIVLPQPVPVFGLFAGSVLAGASIGIIGVLLPGILVKRDFPRQAGGDDRVYTRPCAQAQRLAAGRCPRRWRSSSATGNWRWRSGRCRRSCRRLLAAADPPGPARPSPGLPCHRPVARPAGLAGHAVHGPAIVPGLHRLRLACRRSCQPRHDCGKSRPGAVPAR